MSSQRDFLTVAADLAMIDGEVARELAEEAVHRNAAPAQLALEKGHLSAVQVDIVDTLMRPTDVIPGYEILDALGHGGMGVVYRARQQNLDRIVALKTILVSQMADRTVVARFEQEARSVAKLRHPNIVAAFDFGRHEGRLYFAMEYVEGEDVDQLIQRKGQLSEQMAWGLARQAAAGLAHAAQAGIVHRDIKPANLLLVDAPEGFPLPKGMPMVKIADFGLAFLTRGVDADSRLTAADTALGSPHYMSPEQMGSEPIDFQSDIYSLGATVFHMLVGKPPFSGKTLAQTITEKLTGVSQPIRDVRADVSDASQDLIQRMMDREPTRRAADYNQLLDSIDALGHLPSMPPTAVVPVPASHDGGTEAIGDPGPTMAMQSQPSAIHEPAPTVTLPKQPADKLKRTESPRKQRFILWGGVALSVVLLAAVFLLTSKSDEPLDRELVAAGEQKQLFNGQDLGIVWLPVVSPWAVKPDPEDAQSIACTKPTGVVQRRFRAPRHYKVSVQVLLENAGAAELQFAIAEESDSCLALRITNKGVQFGKRANPRAPFEPIGKLMPIQGIRDRYQLLQIERQPKGWIAVFEERTVVGSAPLERVKYLMGLRLAVENGNAWFREIEVDQLVPRKGR
ncbi:MAG: serine/threonine protein kinase [Planctomycetes bacterium]|nr:serine/threonine protein kinase [Planctomycetota bacterium]